MTTEHPAECEHDWRAIDGRWLCIDCQDEKPIESAATTERESREFFYVHDDGRVAKVTGYACETNMGSYWWCPEVGVSAAEGFHLFRDRVDAYDRAHANALDAYTRAKLNLERIEEERWA